MRRWLVNHARVTAWVCNILLIVLIFGLCLAGYVDLFAVIPLSFLCCILVFIAVNGSTARALRDALKILSEQCDPEPLLNLSQVVLRQNAESISYGLYAGFALILLGKKAGALALLQPLEKRLSLWNSPQQAALYCICQSDLSDTAGAALWLDKLERTVGNASGIRQTLIEQRACLALRRGETEGLEPIFQAYLGKAPVLQVRVAWHFELGKLYLAQRRKEEAAEHLRFVAEHGNKLAIRTEAEELLKEPASFSKGFIYGKLD